MSKELVSIIMGAYNCEKTVGKCIESVINQTYTNWEFVICDDCSTDRTLDVLKKYAKEDSRIKVIKNKKNSKLAYSLNHCLKYCKGVYIARMDADDECVPKRLEKQVLFLDIHRDTDVVGSAAKIFDGEKITGIRKLKEIPTKKDVLKGPTFMHPTIMMRKKVYDALEGYTVANRTIRGQDWDLWFRFFAKGYKGYNLQEPLLIYHESVGDYKKRTLKTAIMYTQTALFGYGLLRVPFYQYIYVVKPLIAALIPQKILARCHKK